MAKNKMRKFADGGFTDLTKRISPLPGYQGFPMAPGGQSSGAYGGLDTVNQGSQQIGQSLQTIGDALGKPGGGGGGLGGMIGVNPFSGGLSDLSGLLKGKPMKKGGRVKAKKSYKSGGKVSSASKRADGCAIKGKTKGRMV